MPDDNEIISRLRQMALAGGRVGELVAYLRNAMPGPDITFGVVHYFRRAFDLPLYEARLIEGSTLLGGRRYTSEQTEELVLPLILQNKDLWAPAE